MLLALCWILSQPLGLVETNASKPNIVFILADDLGWGELGCYGQKLIPTANIDQLAKSGTRFTQHYSGAPVCAPSRCVLMTGKHLGHAEVRGNQQASVKLPEYSEGQVPLSADAGTFPMLLQKAGYKTAAIGKWGLGPVGSTGDPNKKGFDLFFGYNCQAVAHSYYPPYLWRNGEKVMINEPAIPRNKKMPDGEVNAASFIAKNYAPKLMIEEAEKFIAQNANGPFFLYLPFIEPHVAMHPPEESVNRFPKEWDQEAYRGGNGYLPHPRPRAAYAAMISDLDSYVGRVVKALEKAKLLDNTLIIFTSDNGTTHAGNNEKKFHVGGVDAKYFNSTAGLRGYKGSVYEGGIRVPMIASYPKRIPVGVVNNNPSYFADWFPTLCRVAEVPYPDGMDGDNLWREMAQGDIVVRSKPMLWYFPEYGGQVAVREGDMKVVRTGLSTKNPGEWEVYDISKDPGESKNLAQSKPELIERAKAFIRKEVSENKNFPLHVPGL